MARTFLSVRHSYILGTGSSNYERRATNSKATENRELKTGSYISYVITFDENYGLRLIPIR